MTLRAGDGFAGLVAARRGYDPFVDEAPLALRVELRPRGGGTAGSLQLSSDGASKGERSMTAAPGDCYELVASLALAAAVAVDPESALSERPEPAPAPAPSPVPPPVVTAAPPPPETPVRAEPGESDDGVRFSFVASALESAGTQPGFAPGLRLGAALRSGIWSVGLEGAAFVSSELERPYGTVSAHALYGSVVPCVHAGSEDVDLGFCAALSLGALFSDATGVDRSEPSTDPYATAGPRVGVTIRATDVVGVLLTAEAPVTLTRVHLFIQDGGEEKEAWASSRVGFVGGAGVVITPR